MPQTSSASTLERSGTTYSTFSAIVGWCLLVTTDVVVSIGGAPALLRMVKACPVRHRRADRRMEVDELIEAMRQASVFGLHHYKCLKYWAATTCLLRLFGQPASFVIGITKTPFRSHAWLEHPGGVAGYDDEMPGIKWVVVYRA
jgi:hypothetical protein